MEEFDYKKFLVENKLTPNSRLLSRGHWKSELNEENINVDDDHLLWVDSGNRLADGSGNLVFAKDGDKYFSGSGKISGGEVTMVKNTKEISQRQYELYLRMWTQVQKNLTSPMNEDLDENELNEEFDISMDEFVYEKNQELIKYISSKTGVSEADAAAKAGQWLMKLAKGVNSVS